MNELRFLFSVEINMRIKSLCAIVTFHHQVINICSLFTSSSLLRRFQSVDAHALAITEPTVLSSV